MSDLIVPAMSDDHLLTMYEFVDQIEAEFQANGWDTYYMQEATIMDHLFLMTSLNLFQDYGQFTCPSGGFSENNSSATKAKYQRLDNAFLAVQPSTGLEILITCQQYENDDAVDEYYYAVVASSRELPTGAWVTNAIIATMGDKDTVSATLTIDCSGPITTSCTRTRSLIYDGSPDVQIACGTLNLVEPGWTDNRISHDVVVEPEFMRRTMKVPGPWPYPVTVIIPPGVTTATVDTVPMQTVTVNADYYDEQDVVLDSEGQSSTTVTLIGDGTPLFDLTVQNVPADEIISFYLGTTYLGIRAAPTTSETSTLKMTLPDGTYTVVAYKEGYVPVETEVIIDGAAESVDYSALSFTERVVTEGSSGGEDNTIGGLSPETNVFGFKCHNAKGYKPADCFNFFKLEKTGFFGLDKVAISLDTAVEFDPTEYDLVIEYVRDMAVNMSTVISLEATDFTDGVYNAWSDMNDLLEAHNLIYYNIDYDSAYAVEEFSFIDISRLIGQDTLGKGPCFVPIGNTEDYQELRLSGGLRDKEFKVNLSLMNAGDTVNMNRHLADLFPTVEETGDVPDDATDTTQGGGSSTSSLMYAGAGILAGLLLGALS